MAKTTSAAIKMDPMRVTLADIQRGITVSKQLDDFKAFPTTLHCGRSLVGSPKQQPQHIKVTLRKTNEILLYEQRSLTVLADTDEGKAVAADNERYEYLTSAQGRRRRTFSAEAQTAGVLYKSRDVNTEHIRTDNIASYVSNFEMFDTYKDLQTTTKSVAIDEHKKMEITTYKVEGKDTFIDINRQPSFRLALMLTMRVLAGNVFEQQQRRFRNMRLPDPLAAEVRYRYRAELLWRFELPQALAGNMKKAVADLSWCPRNGDILAVAYGVYNFRDDNANSDGCVCIWSIKNPVNPERYYKYQLPVIAVEFSLHNPQLLAIGLSDGTIEVLDITKLESAAIAVTDRRTLHNCEPIVAIKWISRSELVGARYTIEPFLALSRDGSVTKYSIINSPQLLANKLLLLNRIEAQPEGIRVERSYELLQANRHPQGLNLCLSPTQDDLYYVLTEEGCLYKCSTHYPQQYLTVLQVQEAGANAMDFSPWSPKLFLTCGNDWSINIWLDGIFEPIISLKHHEGPIHCAYWSRTHSTIIISLCRNSVDIWDIKQSVLKPMSSTSINGAHYTSCRLSLCGRSLAVGNETGNVLMLAFEDMPFPAYYQYDQLEKAIYNLISNDKEMTHKVKSLGFFGYAEHVRYQPKKRRRMRKKIQKDTNLSDEN
ncbi:dynein axonemal intermediate chain 4 [Bactrocera neohumeralis]|uniref:dynein axonemal intermediate chain 4 n=1 Tax=Bactrocera neohumeralis TaxID=98809 RepID=UPI002166A118|nr:dynein axonemal intermediate chain 4 [Bactrocera neohumeralis]